MKGLFENGLFDDGQLDEGLVDELLISELLSKREYTPMNGIFLYLLKLVTE